MFYDFTSSLMQVRNRRLALDDVIESVRHVLGRQLDEVSRANLIALIQGPQDWIAFFLRMSCVSAGVFHMACSGISEGIRVDEDLRVCRDLTLHFAKDIDAAVALLQAQGAQLGDPSIATPSSACFVFALYINEHLWQTFLGDLPDEVEIAKTKARMAEEWE